MEIDKEASLAPTKWGRGIEGEGVREARTQTSEIRSECEYRAFRLLDF